MVNLIVVVIAIALTILIAVAVSYYGGDLLSDGQRQGRAAGLVSQSQQIAGAIEMFKTDNPNGELASVSELVPQYLKSVPEGWELSSVNLASMPGYVAYPLAGTDDQKEKVCEEVNKKLGLSGPIPACSAVSSSFTGCCTSS